MDKSPDAFRTISEVAEALETPAHVLRFWESRFPQIRPVKRAGGRRYYRPADVALLTGIKRLLHDEGMTIRGVQKILREQGIRHVSGLSDDITPEEEALDAAMIGRLDDESDTTPTVVEEATAAALEAALKAPNDDSLSFSAIPPDSPPDSPPELPPDSPPESPPAPPAELPLGQPPEIPADAPPEVPPSEAPEERQAALDWLASLPGASSAAAHPAAEPPPPPPTPARPALAVRAIIGARARSESPDLADDATATIAARLRALPLGSLASRPEALREVADRITRLRDRLAGHPPRG